MLQPKPTPSVHRCQPMFAIASILSPIIYCTCAEIAGVGWRITDAQQHYQLLPETGVIVVVLCEASVGGPPDPTRPRAPCSHRLSDRTPSLPHMTSHNPLRDSAPRRQPTARSRQRRSTVEDMHTTQEAHLSTSQPPCRKQALVALFSLPTYASSTHAPPHFATCHALSCICEPSRARGPHC